MKTLELSQLIYKQPKDEPERVTLKCKNWACGKTFTQNEKDKVCVYHPGKFQFGSVNVVY